MKIQAFTGLGHLLARVTALMLVALLLLAALPAVQASASPALSITTIGISGQTGTLEYGTPGSVTFTVFVAGDTDVPSSTLSVTGLPAGATGSFSPNPVSCGTPSCVVPSTLTVSTAIHTFAVTGQSFTVHSDTNSVTGSGSLTITRRALSVAAVDNIKTYDGGTTAAASPTVTGLVTGDTANYTEAYTDKNFGVGNKTLVPSGTVSDANSGNNYTITLNDFTTGTINKKAITVTAVTNTKTYDGNATAATLPNNSGVVGSDTPAFIEAYLDKAAATGKTLTPSGTVSDGNSGLNYSYTFNSVATGVINKAGLTMSGATVVGKVYDGLLTATLDGSPSLVGIISGDTVNLGATPAATFVDKNVGAAKTVTITAPGYTITGADAGNYTLTQPTVTGTITVRPITVTAASTSKPYDGTNSSSGVPTLTSGTLGSGDSATWTQSYDNKNVGAANKTITPAGTVSDGNGGANYTVTLAPVTNGTITARAITVTALSGSKPYDGNNTSVGVPNITVGTLASGDTATWTQTYDNKNVGAANKTITPAGAVTDGNGGANYTVTLAPVTNGTITARGLTITGATATTKIYDGTTAATLDGAPVLVGAVSGDLVSLGAAPVGTFVDKNVGAAKAVTITAPGYSLAGTDAPNYTLTQPTVTGAITAKPITVTAITNTKVYDGLLTAAALPTNSGLATGDTLTTFIEAYSTDSAGVGNKTLIPSGLVTDGNSGLNYAYTYVNFTTGTISQKPITVTAIPFTKTYDGTTAATGAVPTNSGLATGDTLTTFVEAYSDKNFGLGNKTLTPSGLVTDGNSGLNYLYTYTPVATGTINKKAVTVTAANNSRVYNGTTAAAALPTVNPALAAGDAASFIEAYSDKNAGPNNTKTLIPSGTINDGNTGLNYTVTFANFTTGTISKASLTVTAKPIAKPFNTDFSFLGTEFTTGTIYHGDFVANATLSSTGSPAAAAVNTYPILISNAQGTGLTNYNLSYINGTMTVAILPAAPVITEGASTTVTMSVNGHPTPFSLTLNATDPNSDPLTWSILTAAGNGTASILGTNPGNSMAIGYSPTAANFRGTDSFVVQVDDGTGKTDSITVNVAVNPINVSFISTAAYDGWVLESGENTNVGSLLNSTSPTFAVGDDIANKQYRAILSFNTGPLPDNAVISSVTLKIRRQGVVGIANPFLTLGSLLVDIQKGNFGTPVLQPTDFQVVASKNAVLSFTNTLANTWYARSLLAANFTFINKVGNTQFRLRFTTDDNNNHKADYLLFFSGNAPVGSQPVLLVQYYLP